MKLRHCLLLLALGAAACDDDASAAKKGPGGPGGGPPPAKVAVASVTRGALRDQRTFLGQTRPVQRAELAASVSGKVEAVLVREGDSVKAGDPLVELDRALVEPQLAAARAREARTAAELAQARRELERAKKLPHPVITDAEREKFEARVDMLVAQARADTAETKRLRAELDRHVVAAPFDGVVSARHVEPGVWVNAGQPTVGLVSSQTLEVTVQVAQSLLPHLAPGEPAVLVGPGDATAPAEIRGVVPTLDATTRTIEVRLAPTGDRPPWLVAGMALDVRFDVPVGEGLLVPRDALVRTPAGVRIVKAVDGKAAPVNVQVTATADATALVVAEGLAAGDTVVTRGNERVRPGQPLQVVE